MNPTSRSTESPQDDDDRWRILYPIQTPTAILFQLYDNVASHSKKHLALARESQIEIFHLSPHGLQLSYIVPIKGKLCSFTAIQLFSSESKSLLYTLDDSTVHICHCVNGTFAEVLGFQLVSDPPLIPAELGHAVSFNPAFGLLAIHIHHGRIHLLQLRRTGDQTFRQGITLTELFPLQVEISVDFYNVTSISFETPALYKSGDLPSLMVVYAPYQQSTRFRIYSFPPNLVDYLSSKVEIIGLLAIPIPLNGSLRGWLSIETERVVQYWKHKDGERYEQFETVVADLDELPIQNQIKICSKKVTRHIKGLSLTSNFISFAVIDESRILAASANGSLILLTVRFHEENLESITFQKVGSFNRPTGLLHITDDLYFIYCSGPPSLIKLDIKRKSFDIIQEFEAVGPIVDISAKQSSITKEMEIFFASGGYESSCINKLTSGIVIDTLAEASVPVGIERIWFDELSSSIIASVASGTEILNMSDNTNPPLLEFKSRTLAFYRTATHQIQVTDCGIFLSVNQIMTKSLSLEIRCASISVNYISVSLSPRKVEIYNHKLEKLMEIPVDEEVACVACNEQYVAVSTWSATSWLMVTNMDTRRHIIIPAPGNCYGNAPDVVLSLIIRSYPGFGSETFVFAGCGNGTLLIHRLSLESNETIGLFHLGPAHLHLHSTETSVIVASDQIYEVLLTQSHDLIEVKFHLLITDHIVMAGCTGKWSKSPRAEQFITITDQNKLLILDITAQSHNILQRHHQDGIVQRILLSNNEKHLIVLLIEVKSQYDISPRILLYDPDTLQHQSTYSDTARCCIPECVINVTPTHDSESIFFCVGCAELGESKYDKGRIILYQIINNEIYKVQSYETPGPVSNMAFNKNVLSVVIKDEIFRHDFIVADGALEKRDHPIPLYNSVTFSKLLVTSINDTLAVGDTTERIQLLDMESFIMSQKVAKISEDPGKYLTSLELISDDILAMADLESTFLIHHQGKDKNYTDFLEFGSTINCIRRIPSSSVSTRLHMASSCLVPEAILGTSSGGLYIQFQVKDSTVGASLQNLLQIIEQKTHSLLRVRDGGLPVNQPQYLLDGRPLVRLMNLFMEGLKDDEHQISLSPQISTIIDHFKMMSMGDVLVE